MKAFGRTMLIKKKRLELLRVKNEAGVKTEWNAAPGAITANAEWFYPYLDPSVSAIPISI